MLFHACTNMISLREGKGEQRITTLVMSPCLPEAEASFQIGSDGINEYKG